MREAFGPRHSMDPVPYPMLVETIGTGTLDFKAASIGIWRGLAVVMVHWTGRKVAVSRRFDPWECVRLVLALES
ncbi:MAG: hypothetical protein OXU26_00020, partial [Acidobacteriota bacterium]|nr:hypothetical protein [Acidobacteriota bacterium]